MLLVFGSAKYFKMILLIIYRFWLGKKRLRPHARRRGCGAMHHGTASMHWQTMCSSLLLLRQRYFPVHMPKLNAVEAKPAGMHTGTGGEGKGPQQRCRLGCVP
jgi:hypothetical protein